MGSKEKNLIQQARRSGMPIPDRIANKPRLAWGLELYLFAFYELQFDRNESGSIPWLVIMQYASFNEFSKEQSEKLIYFVRELDRVYQGWLNNKGPKNGKP